MDHVQIVVAKALNIPEGSIEVKVNRKIIIIHIFLKYMVISV